jgi:hypothetical protein
MVLTISLLLILETVAISQALQYEWLNHSDNYSCQAVQQARNLAVIELNYTIFVAQPLSDKQN